MSVFFGFWGARFSEFSPQGNPSVCHGRQLPLHRGAMGSRCPPGVDRLFFGLIGRRRFGGRGGSEAPPFLRTEMPLRDIPVLRMAYFTIKPYYGLISKTLMLQVRSAHPPMPHRNVFFKTFRCFGRLIFRFRTDPPSVRRCSARLIRQAETLELQPRSRPPSSHTMAFAPKRSTSRFAPLTLRCRTEMFF